MLYNKLNYSFRNQLGRISSWTLRFRLPSLFLKLFMLFACITKSGGLFQVCEAPVKNSCHYMSQDADMWYCTCQAQSRKSKKTGDSWRRFELAKADFAQRSPNGCPACSHSRSSNASNLHQVYNSKISPLLHCFRKKHANFETYTSKL